MKKIYTLGVLFSFLLLKNFTFAQCTSCNVTNPTGSPSLNGIICFTTNTTLGDVNLGTDVTLCISPNVTVTIQNNIASTLGNKLAINIGTGGSLYINQPLSLKADLNMSIASTGLLKMGGSNYVSDLKLLGNKNTINNLGKMEMANWEITNNISNNNFVSSSNLLVNGNMNINQGTTLFQNKGVFSIGQGFSSNANTKFVNCGTMTIAYNFNLGGGTITNTNILTHENGNADLGTGKLYNYGTYTDKGSQVGGQTSSLVYNEGIFNVVSYAIGNTIQGPSNDKNKKGYFYIQNPISNSLDVGPNLDFTKVDGNNSPTSSQGVSSIFSSPSSITYKDENSTTVGSASAAGVTFHCTSCTLPVGSIDACPLPDNPIVTPVQLTTFYAVNNKNENQLYWNTASEINFKYFDVQKSENNHWGVYLKF